MKGYVAIVLLILTAACGHDDPSSRYSCGEEIRLGADIMPIISTQCAINACHANAISPILNTTTDVIAQAERIQEVTTAGTMPPGGQPPLTSEEIERISCWVTEGAKNN